MKTAFSCTGTEKSERRIYYMAPAFAVELNPKNGTSPESAALYDGEVGDDGFTQNTSACD